jgi:hypothetical protein
VSKIGQWHLMRVPSGPQLDGGRGLAAAEVLILIVGGNRPAHAQAGDVPIEGDTQITVTAYWHPAGVWSLPCWYLLAPVQGLIFRGMTREIARRAEGAPTKLGSQVDRVPISLNWHTMPIAPWHGASRLVQLAGIAPPIG